MIKWK